MLLVLLVTKCILPSKTTNDYYLLDIMRQSISQKVLDGECGAGFGVFLGGKYKNLEQVF
jgi:hypothetical protein